MPSAPVRRRRVALGVAAVVAAAAGAVVGAAPDGRTGARHHRIATGALTVPPRTAPITARDVDLAVGQRIVTAIDGPVPSARLLRRVRAGRVGGVILFPRNVPQARTSVARLQAAARAGGRPPLLVMVDQEGGPVKRFATLPPSRAPRAMGDPATARAEAVATARALRGQGLNVDLAPVADVTTDTAGFLWARTFPSPAAACAFADGLRAGGVLPALKHFPGLGGAGANTDDRDVTIAADLPTLRGRAAAYRTCGRRVGLVMIASARYPAATGPRPALVEPRTYALLRALGVTAPTISDSLQGRALRSTPHVAIQAVRAGLDLLLSTGGEDAANDLWKSLRDATRRGFVDRRVVVAGADRIRALKARLP